MIYFKPNALFSEILIMPCSGMPLGIFFTPKLNHFKYLFARFTRDKNIIRLLSCAFVEYPLGIELATVSKYFRVSRYKSDTSRERF